MNHEGANRLGRAGLVLGDLAHLPDREEVFLAAEEDLSVENCSRGKNALAEVVGAQQFVRSSCADDERLPPLAGRVDLSVGGEERGSEPTAKPLLIHLGAGLRIET